TESRIRTSSDRRLNRPKPSSEVASTVSTPKNTMNSAMTQSTITRVKTCAPRSTRRQRPSRRVAAREQADRQQAEREAADVGEVGDTFAHVAGQPGEPEQQLRGEPEAEQRERRQLDDRDEEDDEDDREHLRTRVQQDVAAEYRGDRAGGAERGA